MRKFLFCALSLVFTGLAAEDAELSAPQPVYIDNVIITPYTYPMVTLTDGSIWVLHTMVKQTQTWTQWWYGVKPMQPSDEWVCKFSDWSAADTVRLFTRDRSQEQVPEELQTIEIKKSEYIIENIGLKQYAFARRTDIKGVVEALKMAMNEQYKKGVKEGQTVGYNSGFIDGKNTGYTRGYQSGLETGKKTGYKNGYDDGKEGRPRRQY